MRYLKVITLIVLIIGVTGLNAKVWQNSWADPDGDMTDEEFSYVIGENGEINIPYEYCPWTTIIAWKTARTCLSVMKLRQIIYWDEERILDTGALPEVPNWEPFYYEDTYYDTMYTVVEGDKVVTIWKAPLAKLKRVVDLRDERGFIRFYLWYHETDCWKYLGSFGLLVTWNDGMTTIESSKQYVLDQLQGLKEAFSDSFPSHEPGEFTFKIEYACDDWSQQLDDYCVLAWDGYSGDYPDTRAIFGTLQLPKPDYFYTENNPYPCSRFTYANWSLGGEQIIAGVRITPRTINLRSHGVFKAAIYLPEGYDPEQVDVSTVVCEGARAVDGHATQNAFRAKFKVDDLKDITPGIQEFIVSGKLKNGESFSGSDFVNVIDAGFVVLDVTPNPLHKNAVINYDLSPSVDKAEVRIFSVTGALIKTIPVEKSTSGLNKKVVWDRTDKNGRSVPAGVYLIQLKGGRAVKTEKVIVTK